MQASNFLLQSGIYLVAGNAQLDLHNDYDFVSVEFNVAVQAVDLRWQRSSSTRVSKDLPLCVSLKFEDVTHFEAIPGDPSFPKSESLCLSSFGYCTNDEWGKSQFWVEKEPEQDWGWSFQFQSKQEFRIRGAKAKVEFKH
ncbi:hypothetical protein CLU85_4285 [Acidovorax sp. 69]|uniref:hypothetical protein n=1 Tax=Acidovorax sp. 69 TaxID=2035202 RepID=UPI000C246E48|nr:hypothetical protein [Acidovorax sp. 69]PJI99441.1 hypothetical protein CLU85_4285 [Acidovorax sp. 69]